MGFRNPITTATAVDTGHGLADAGVRLYQDLSFPATPAGVAEWRTGLMQRNATATLRGGGSGGSAFTLDGGASAGSVDAGRLTLAVDSLQAGGYGSSARLTAARIVLDGTVDRAVPTAAIVYASAFRANPAGSPLTVSRDPNKRAYLQGLIQNVVSVSNPAGLWLTVPAGFAPAATVLGWVLVEGGGLVDVQLTPDGKLTGLGLRLGTAPIPTPRYWSIDLTYDTP